MSKKVAVFVWNHFTNDARVSRECMALQEAGYHVDLIAIHDPEQENQSFFEQVTERFTIRRVNYAKQSKIILLIFWMLFLILLPFFPRFMLIIGAILTILMLPKAQMLVRRSMIFSLMIYYGLRKKYDFYHANDLNTLPQAILCAKVFRRKKLIYDSHEIQTSRTGYNSPLYGICERFFLRFTDVCIHENQTRAAYIQDKYHFYPKVVHNYPNRQFIEGSDRIDLHQVLHISKDEPILLYQGGVQVGRGLDKLIQAVPMFQKGVVVIIGDGRIKLELEKQVLDAELGQKIRFLPKVPLQDLLYYTKNAYLGFQLLNNVCFNHYSASSNKLFEYVMSGVPVIGSDFPEIRRIIKGEEVGVVVDSHSPTSIAAAVNELLANPALRERYSQNCYRAREIYNWEHEKKLFLEIYSELENESDFERKKQKFQKMT
ncbi:glycosyltransferase [Listeria rustica]|uniref:Glycosyltransferase n=1 Tax=Listeria rustica TaxID=2713503 RepID=A0A7W1T4Z9_9LIST|nr:glycosyltransferase [Listeria rustica]MBA3925416.1 glycosyltransferase [Listeria rustica]